MSTSAPAYHSPLHSFHVPVHFWLDSTPFFDGTRGMERNVSILSEKNMAALFRSSHLRYTKATSYIVIRYPAIHMPTHPKTVNKIRYQTFEIRHMEPNVSTNIIRSKNLHKVTECERQSSS